MSSQRFHVTVLITSYNRREVTLACLDRVADELPSLARRSVVLEAILVDDASTDGTAEAVRQRHGSWVTVTSGPGDLFWARGMAVAMTQALRGQPDAMILLNDDVQLLPGAISRLLDLGDQYEHTAVLIGATIDAITNEITYSGLRRRSTRPNSLERVPPHGLDATPVDTFNANIVLVPRRIIAEVGVIDASFEHGYGDLDYGYRCTAAGFKLILAPEPLGFCSRNRETGAARSRWGLLRALFDRKGYPPRSHAKFLRRHGGRLWPVYFAGTYIGAMARIIRSRRG